MAGKVAALFRRYAARHLALRMAGPGLTAPDGTPIGQVEALHLRNGRLMVEGHADAAQVALRLGGRWRTTVPAPRPGGRAGFRLDLPFMPGVPVLELALAGRAQPVTLPLPVFTPARLAGARVALMPGFALRGLRALPAALRWIRHQDPAARHEVRRLLDLGSDDVPRPLDPALFHAVPGHVPPPAPAAPVTVILPVYNRPGSLDLLTECLDRMVRHSDLPWRLVVIDDASPDPAVRPLLHGLVARHPGQVILLENDGNLGFIGSVNRGLATAAGLGGDAPVVLLNSDALVPAGWLSRLVAPILADPATVASVTPMSNDAELACVPVICARGDLRPGEADAVDAAAQALPPGAGLAEAPTGVGFCMAMNPRFLSLHAALDTVFGRGYGEEVDWCQKVALAGGRHLYQPRLFVEHRGGVSFGSAEKRQLLQRNGALISSRYPRFDAEVQQFLTEDPLLTARLALGLALAARRVDGPVPVYLAHALGGGAEHWLRDRIAADIAAAAPEGGMAVVLRVGGPVRWRIELHAQTGMTWGETADTGLMRHLLDLLPRRHVVYSCGVGDPDPLDLPDLLLALAGRSAPDVAQVKDSPHRLDVLFHDFFPISPAYTLLDSAGRWSGLPDPQTTDRAHLLRRPDGTRCTLAQWQAEWGRLVRAADAVTVFSASSRDLVAGAWPGIAAPQVRPHRLRHAVPRLPAPPPDAPPVIGVLGNIGPHKGAGLLVELSRRLATTRAAGLVLIGQLDPAYALVPPARVHGSYALDEIPALVARYGITCWLIPSVWPETFSYATHEALATGLPVWCLDLGAQAEAVVAAIAAGAPGGVIPLDNGQADSDRVLARLTGIREQARA